MPRYLLPLAVCARINRLFPPVAGCPTNGGLQIVIPADWRAQIAAGNPILGCNHVLPDADGAVFIPPQLIARLQASQAPDAIAVVLALSQLQPIPDPPDPDNP